MKNSKNGLKIYLMLISTIFETIFFKSSVDLGSLPENLILRLNFEIWPSLKNVH